MYVLGETNLDRYKIHYDGAGEILPEVPGDANATPEGSAGFILWVTRPLEGGDRHLFAGKADDEEDSNSDRDALVALTVSVEGLAAKNGDGETIALDVVTDENYDHISAAILARAMKRITGRMKATHDALSESEKPSDS